MTMNEWGQVSLNNIQLNCSHPVIFLHSQNVTYSVAHLCVVASNKSEASVNINTAMMDIIVCSCVMDANKESRRQSVYIVMVTDVFRQICNGDVSYYKSLYTFRGDKVSMLTFKMLVTAIDALGHF